MVLNEKATKSLDHILLSTFFKPCTVNLLVLFSLFQFTTFSDRMYQHFYENITISNIFIQPFPQFYSYEHRYKKVQSAVRLEFSVIVFYTLNRHLAYRAWQFCRLEPLTTGVTHRMSTIEDDTIWASLQAYVADRIIILRCHRCRFKLKTVFKYNCKMNSDTS